MIGLVSGYIEHFTYLALFLVLVLCGLGLPLPEDVALLAGGFLAHRGVTQLPITLAVSFVGVITGDNSLFFLGRHLGQGLLKYFGLNSPGATQRIERLREFMGRHGHRTIFYARFLAGLRALVYLSAGSLGVTPSRFFLYDAAGALISVPLVVGIGFYYGAHLERIVHYIGGLERVVLIVAALTLAVYATRLMAPGRRQTPATVDPESST